MRAQRYQRGSLSILKRKSQPDAWVFRYYTRENGHRVYKRQYVGSVVQFPKRKDAERAIAQFRVEINEGGNYTPLNFEQVIAHYKKEELPHKAYSTRVGYTDALDRYILPEWGGCVLSSIKSIEVEKWLSGIRKRNGTPTSPSTKAKIRNVMSAVFSHAIRWGWAQTNPITAVRTSAQRLREPDILSPAELQALLKRLPQRERLMVLLDVTTGLRRGELMALRWQDLDFESMVANITRSIWRNVVGGTKTAASKKPVPLHPLVVGELSKWKEESLYKADSDFVFPSVQKSGMQPLQPDMILKRHIRPALKQMGVDKKIGWHSLRHSLGTMLRQMKIDVKIAQEMLRHANPGVTLGLYQQAMMDEKREAQDLALKGFLGPSLSFSTLQHPKPEEKEEVILGIA